ncbi:MAG: TRAP transporter small permease subunit, partial [bacterium]|nr:TRAP transporter small permease subunit [bacterium]
MKKFLMIIDAISDRTGRIVGWIAVPMIIALIYEVFARYIFHRPTIWSYEITYMIYGTHFLLGAAYTLRVKGHNYQKEMQDLAVGIEHVYEQLLQVVAKSPAEIVLWGANYDDMITYPSYYKTELQPWLQKASRTLEENGKLMICHTDGENRGLMDLIRDSGLHIAEAVC